MLHEYFEEIWCINLDSRNDKWNECFAEFEKFNIQNVHRFSAINGYEYPKKGNLRQGELGCILSHLTLIKYAKNKNLDNILILEDDVEFSDNLTELFPKYFSQLPEWDILMFGGNHIGGTNKITENVKKIFGSYTTHCYALKNNLFDKIINLLETQSDINSVPIDVSLSKIHRENNCYCFHPHLAYQRKTFSDINQCEVDYTFLRQ